MDKKTIFVKTSKGEEEARSKTTHLSDDIKRSLLMIDGSATFGEISKRAAPSLRSSLEQMFKELMQGGFIQEKIKSSHIPKMVVPTKAATPIKKPLEVDSDNELDFASGYIASQASGQVTEADDAQERAATEAKATQETEARARVTAEAKARQEIEARARAEAEAQSQARQVAEARARAEAEAKAIAEAQAHTAIEMQKRVLEEASAKQETEEKARAEAEARAAIEIQARALEAAREKSEAEARARDAIEEKSRFEASARTALEKQARALEEARVKQEAEARIRAEAEEKARVAIEIQARALAEAKAKLEAEARARVEAEAKARALAEVKAKLDAEVRARAEAESRSRALAEEKARQEAEAKVRAEAKTRQELEAARLKAQQADEAGRQKGQQGTPEVKLEPFNFSISNVPPSSALPRSVSNVQQRDVALMNEIGKFIQSDQANKPPAATSANQTPPQEVPSTSESATAVARSAQAIEAEAETRKSVMDEVKKLEKAQAKVWTEAEQRAKQAAKAKAMWDVQPSDQPQPAARVSAPVARVRREPLPWLKLVAGLIAMSLIVLFVAPYVVPTREYVPRVEQLLSSKLQQPVYIGRLEWRLLPTPRLDLIDISIGNAKQAKARLARANFDAFSLLTEVKSINSLELEGMLVNGAALQQASLWLQQSAANTEYPIERFLLREGVLEADEIQISGVGGELNFNRFGKFELAKLHAEGNKYSVGLESVPGSKSRITISVRGGALPLLPNWIFDDLNARGELTGSELVITDMDSRIRGGNMLGNARINWRSGWRAQGSLVAKAITMQNMFKSLSGDMDGTARFQMQAASLAKLTDTATLDGSFVIKAGVVNGIDIVETARLRSTENLPGGRSHFDELSGEVSYAKGAYAYRNLKMTAGVLNAKGKLDYSEQQLAGQLVADLTLRGGIGPVPLQLGGTSDNPTLRFVR